MYIDINYFDGQTNARSANRFIFQRLARGYYDPINGSIINTRFRTFNYIV